MPSILTSREGRRGPRRAQGSRCSCAEVSPGSVGSEGPEPRGPVGVKGAARSPARQLSAASLCFPHPRQPGSPRSQSASFNSSHTEAGLDVWPPSSASELEHQEPRHTGHPWSWEPEACPVVGTCSFDAASGGRRWCVGGCGIWGDSQVGSMEFCAPETPIHKTV